ncbi:ATP-binding protein [Streptomyces sp. NPDC015220]|uniref:ATP-binding protein n=1 Tax=Streptomyces sp. NPDC015220 TaxID=3364947 RepID=UPI0036F91A85
MTRDATATNRCRRFPPVTASIAAARQWAVDCLRDSGNPLLRPRHLEITELIVSELVTNAIRHGTGAPEIGLTWDGTLLRISVSDHCDRLPELRATPVAEPGGFGIRLIAQLSHRWGVARHSPGKTVWAELTVEA